MSVVPDELNFQRLLYRIKKLSRDALAENKFKLESSIGTLDLLYIKLQDSSIDQGILMQYGRELSSLKSLLEVEKLKTAEEKLEAIERLPRIFPGGEQEVRKRKGTLDTDDDQFEDKVSNAILKATNEAIYKADIRRQLLSGGKTVEQAQNLSDIDFVSHHEDQQKELSDELLRLTTALKTNVEVAGSVIKEDNQTVSKMLHLSEQNKSDLSKESQRLEQYTKRSCMDFMMIMTVVLVIWVFLGTVVVMKFFRKRI